jgi:hypothetical protein
VKEIGAPGAGEGAIKIEGGSITFEQGKIKPKVIVGSQEAAIEVLGGQGKKTGEPTAEFQLGFPGLTVGPGGSITVSGSLGGGMTGKIGITPGNGISGSIYGGGWGLSYGNGQWGFGGTIRF